MDFYKKFGFKTQPFEFTNAAEEPLIKEYFIDPPFFPSVIGDPASPKTSVVFAPRGGGKTAQKIMLEAKSESTKDFLCITYDDFYFFNGKKPTDIKQDDHLFYINRKIIAAIAFHFLERSSPKDLYTSIERDWIISAFRRYFVDASKRDLESSINSIKNIGHRTDDFFKKHGSAVISIFNAISSKFGLSDLDLKQAGELPAERERYWFEKLIGLSQKLGYKSVYILIDRVDELPETTKNPDLTFQLVKPLVVDLTLLETRGVAFKFFLWDRIQDQYNQEGGRADRIPEYRLKWTFEDLTKVLSRRLQAHSNGRISSFRAVSARPESAGIHFCGRM